MTLVGIILNSSFSRSSKLNWASVWSHGEEHPTEAKVIELVKKFRRKDNKTPIVLMGYFNPIHAYGTARFARDVAAAGVDGLIAVDLPIEEDEVLRVPAKAQGVDLIRFVTPTTDEARLKRIAAEASGYLYYVSVAGVTGTELIESARTRVTSAELVDLRN